MTTFVAWAAFAISLLVLISLLTLAAVMRRFWRQLEPQLRPYLEMLGGRMLP